MASGGPNDPGSWNRYAYTRGDPVNRIDPNGLADCPPTLFGVCFTLIDLSFYTSANANFVDSFTPYNVSGAINASSIAAQVQAATAQAQRFRCGGGPCYSPGGWAQLNAALDSALTLVQNLQPTGDCAADLGALMAATGVDFSQVIDAVENANWVDMSTSTDTVCSATLQNDTNAYNFFCNQNPSFTFQQYAAVPGNVGNFAWTGGPGTPNSGNIYFNPNALGANPFTPQVLAGTLLHEAFHQLGALDGTLLTALGYDPSTTSSEAVTNRLFQDCFR
jgi:hypothetical protein